MIMFGQTVATSRYTPMSLHAQGGLGEVYVARDHELSRCVAVKVILDHRANDPEVRQRFVQEAEITAGLEHPGVVPVHGMGTDAGGRLYYAMRLIAGRTMRDVIADVHGAGPVNYQGLEMRRLLGSFVTVCRTVNYAHSRGVVHRDLKPPNIMIGQYGETLVLDWGLAKRLEEARGLPPVAVSERPGLPLGEGAIPTPPRGDVAAGGELTDQTAAMGSGSSVQRSGAGLTTEGQALGTPGYMSPEQAYGKVPELQDQLATDIYSLGATLYHIVTSQTPLAGHSEQAMMMLTVLGQVPAARKVAPDVPAALSAICARAMALRPGDRYASAEALAADVERYLADEPVSVMADSLRPRLRRWARRRPAVVATALASLLTLGLAATAAAGILGRINSQLRDSQDALRQERDRAQEAHAQANQNLEHARAVLGQCLDIARDHPVFARPGMAEARALLLKAAVPFHDRLAELGHASEIASDLKTEAVLAKVEAALQMTGNPNPVEAVALFGACVSELRCLVEQFPQRASYLAALGTCHQNLGMALAQTRDRSGAQAAYREALAIRQTLAERYPDVAGYRGDLAATHTALGNLLAASGRHPDAQGAYQAAIALQERLTAQRPDDARMRSELATNYNQLAISCRKSGQQLAAVLALRSALVLYEGLVAGNPTEPAYRIDLAAAWCNLGNAYRDGTQFEMALAAYDQAFQGLAEMLAAPGVRSPSLDGPPGTHAAQVRLVARNTHWGRATVEIRRDRPAAAAADLRAALAYNDDPRTALTLRRGLVEAESRLAAGTPTP